MDIDIYNITKMVHNLDADSELEQNDSYHVDMTKCHVCDVLTQRTNCKCICPKCGLVICDNIDMSEDYFGTGYDNSGPLKVSGSGSIDNVRVLHRVLMGAQRNNGITETTVDTEHLLEKEFFKRNYDAINQLPKNVIRDGIHMFYKIKEYSKMNSKKEPTDFVMQNITIKSIHDAILRDNPVTYRGERRKGVIAACIFYACQKHNMSKKPREICCIVDAEEKYFSDGLKIVHRYGADGIIDVDVDEETNIANFVSQYLESIKNDNNMITSYTKQTHDAFDTVAIRSFMVDLVLTCGSEVIGGENFRPSTACAGALYIASMCIKIGNSQLTLEKLGIDVERIHKICNISISTVLRYAKIISEYSDVDAVKNTFAKHNAIIPKPKKRGK